MLQGMLLLLLSFLALWSGPWILIRLYPSPKALIWVDRFVIVSILLLIVLHVIPESIEHAGLTAVIAVLFGALWPWIYQKLSHSNNCHIQRSLLSLASVGVLTHTVLDGVAIADDAYLGIAVILHRFPEGLGIWRVAESAFGRRWGMVILVLMMLSTALGYFFGANWLVYASEGLIGLFEGLMAGVLLHVVFHKTHVTHN